MQTQDLGKNQEENLVTFRKQLDVEAERGDMRAFIRLVVAEAASGPPDWHLVYGEVQVMKEAEGKLGPRHSYEGFRSLAESVGVADFAKRFDAARAKEPFVCDGVEVAVHGLHEGWWTDAQSSRNSFGAEPCLVTKSTSTGSPRLPGMLVSPGSPFFHGYRELLAVVATVEGDLSGRDLLYRMQIAIHDYRARFVDFAQPSPTSISVTMAGDMLEKATLRGRFATPTGYEDIDVTAKPVVELPLPDDPIDLSVVLVCDGEVLDSRSFGLPAMRPQATEAAELATATRKLLADGETARVEFKPWMKMPGDEKFREILRTVTGMANMLGGDLIIGVNDYGVPHWNGSLLAPWQLAAKQARGGGANDDPANERLDRETAVEAYARKLRDQIRSVIEPHLELPFDVVRLDNDVVLVLRVPPGPVRPYVDRRDNSYCIRKNATNRPPTPDEIRVLVQPRGPSE